MLNRSTFGCTKPRAGELARSMASADNTRSGARLNDPIVRVDAHARVAVMANRNLGQVPEFL